VNEETMCEFVAIHLPQSGPNDTTATLVEWAKAAGDRVNRGEIVAVAETTKSVFEIEAPQAGYFYPLAEGGSKAAVGAVIAALSLEIASVAAAQAWLAAQTAPTKAASPAPTPQPGKAATKKAELLAQRHGVDLAQVVAAGDRITEADVLAFVGGARGEGRGGAVSEPRPSGRGAAASEPRPSGRGVGNKKTKKQAEGEQMVQKPPSPNPATPQAPVITVRDLVDDRYPAQHVQRLLIIGGGNGAVQIIDALARIPQQRAVAILDDNAAIHGKTVAGVPVIGAIDPVRAAELLATGAIDAAVISVSTSIAFRARIFTAWRAQGIPFANVIHPNAVVGMNVTMGEGNVVMAFCHFGACATVGDNNFLSAYCSIEHHCVLGSHCSFGPGVVTSSRVQIGDGVRFGTGIFIEPGVQIGADTVIASGLAIAQHIPPRSLLKAKVGYTVRSRD
jgi:sugar O-acyltransferase (sialic acid O-acetyltransferase NeuD family)